MIKNQKIYFSLPEESSISEIIDEILKNNGIQESDEEYFNKSMQEDQDSKFGIIYDAVLVVAEKKIPEEKTTELLEQHLRVSKETAQNIIHEIKQRLIPFATTTLPQRPQNKEDFQEELLSKIRANRPTPKETEIPPASYLKEVPILDVEKNAKEMAKEGNNTITEERNKFPKKLQNLNPPPISQNNESDKYKEPVL